MNDTPSTAELPQGTEPSQVTERKPPAFGLEILGFVHDVESLETTLPEIARFLNSFAEQQEKKLQSFLDSKAIEKTHGEEGTRHKLSKDAFPKHMRLHNQLGMAKRVKELVPKSFIVALTSQYDAYLGRIIRLMYLAKPELLNASERSITFAQLLGFGSIEQARERIVEKEVESVLRNSHDDQFAWLEKKLDRTLRKELAVWPSFIELTERRNLFVHCDGVVSDQYLKVCNDHDVKLEPSCQIGKPLSVSSKYFKHACDVVLEIGVKLGHVLWLRLVPVERNDAETFITSLCVELMTREKYELARVLLEFALGTLLRKESSSTVRWMLTVNLAQAHKWCGDEEKCREIIKKHDWNALGHQFRLAVAVLQEDYKAALEIMKKIGSEGDVSKLHYREWPLFKYFRMRNDFLALFKDIFGELFDQDATVENQTVVMENSTPNNSL